MPACLLVALLFYDFFVRKGCARFFFVIFVSCFCPRPSLLLLYRHRLAHQCCPDCRALWLCVALLVPPLYQETNEDVSHAFPSFPSAHSRTDATMEEEHAGGRQQQQQAAAVAAPGAVGFKTPCRL